MTEHTAVTASVKPPPVANEQKEDREYSSISEEIGERVHSSLHALYTTSVKAQLEKLGHSSDDASRVFDNLVCQVLGGINRGKLQKFRQKKNPG